MRLELSLDQNSDGNSTVLRGLTSTFPELKILVLNPGLALRTGLNFNHAQRPAWVAIRETNVSRSNLPEPQESNEREMAERTLRQIDSPTLRS